MSPVTRAASNVAFVLALLFFIPFVTQVAALAVGVYAVARKRLPNERVTLAWLSIVLSALVLPCWLVLFSTVTSFVSSARMFTAPPYAQPTPDEDWLVTGDLARQAERVFQAASAYYRDFGKWPDDLGVLVGRTLPRGFTLSPRLTYRPVPPSEDASTTWVLVVSDDLEHDLDGNRLADPRRLVVRLNGVIDLLPSAQVGALLATQPAEKSTGDGDRP
ncbi:MAG: hypothetical protein PVI86_06840 [Phycisphaerae bacterium]|jgi:hypothetical protein